MRGQWWWVVLAIVVVGIVFWKFQGGGEEVAEDLEEIIPNEVVEGERRAEEFLSEKGIDLPNGATRAVLFDKTGGNATGVVVREQMNGQALYTVLAALPDPTDGWYQAWLARAGNQEPVSLGILALGKGGYLTEVTREFLTDYSRVLVTRETVDDETPELVILEGEFAEE